MTETSFANENVNTENLPQLSELDYQFLSAKYAPTNLIIGIVTLFILLFIATFIYYQPFFTLPNKLANAIPYIGAILLIIGSLQIPLGYWADLKKRYALRQLDLHYASGLFFRKIVSQPITRIQHVELKRGPIDRKVGLAKLQVFSAGGSLHTFEIPGIALERAQQIRQFILQHKAVSKHD